MQRPVGAMSYTAQRPVQGRPRRLHRQQPGQPADGLPGRRNRHDPPRHRAPLQMPTAGITPAGDDRRSGMEMNLDSRAGRDAARAPARRSTSPTPRLTTTPPRRRSTTRKGQEVALTYYFQKAGDRHLERLRRRQRHADRHRRRQPGALDHHHLPDQRRHADGAGGHGRARHPGGRATRSARSRCRSPASPSTSRGATQYGAQFGVTDLAAGRLLAPAS